MGRGTLTSLICACAALLPKVVAAQSANTLPPVPLMRCQEPQFTAEALLAHLAGTVTVSLTVDDDGTPNDIHVVNPLGLGLDEMAVSCMGQFRYSPAQKDGKPVPMKMSVSLGFQDHWESEWHLGKAIFETPEGGLRPVFVKARFPGASAERRGATICVHLTVDKNGSPSAVRISSQQDPKLDHQALSIVNEFRFKPGTKAGKPVEVPATFNLVHGAASRSVRISQ